MSTRRITAGPRTGNILEMSWEEARRPTQYREFAGLKQQRHQRCDNCRHAWETA